MCTLLNAIAAVQDSPNPIQLAFRSEQVFPKIDDYSASARFEDQALVAGAAGDLFAVEILQQWDCVFT